MSTLERGYGCSSVYRTTLEGDDVNDRLWTLQEVADYLGVPLATVYQWRHRGKGPRGFRVGRHVRYDEREVRAWLELRADPRPAA